MCRTIFLSDDQTETKSLASDLGYRRGEELPDFCCGKTVERRPRIVSRALPTGHDDLSTGFFRRQLIRNSSQFAEFLRNPPISRNLRYIFDLMDELGSLAHTESVETCFGGRLSVVHLG
jgi:hypothetical protein